MSKPQPIIEDFAQRAVREHDENKAKLDAARAMLAALEEIAEADRIGDWDEVTRHRFQIIGDVTAAIAVARKAGLKP